MEIAKIFLFQKDENLLLVDWALYHGDLFGFSNLYIIDHNSGKECYSKLERLRQLGVNVTTYSGPFSKKKDELSRLMLAQQRSCEFLVPLDADEFLVIQRDTEISVDGVRECMDKCVRTAKNKMHVFKPFINKYHLVDPLVEAKSFLFVDALLNSVISTKTFYPSKTFISTDQGNHYGKLSECDRLYYYCDLATLHFEVLGGDYHKKKVVRAAQAYGLDVHLAGGTTPDHGLHYLEAYRAVLEDRFEAFFESVLVGLPGVPSQAFSVRIQGLRETYSSVHHGEPR